MINDQQIRLEILLSYYKAMRNQESIPDQTDNEKLKNIDKKDYEFNYGYLVKKDLLKGTIHRSTDGTEHFAPTGGITGHGIDIIENFIDKSVNKIQESGITFANNAPKHVDKISELIMIWSKNMDLYQSAADFLQSLISLAQ